MQQQAHSALTIEPTPLEVNDMPTEGGTPERNYFTCIAADGRQGATQGCALFVDTIDMNLIYSIKPLARYWGTDKDEFTMKV